jgi:hypothetical protein
MIICPNKRSKSWKNLVAARGESVAYNLFFKYQGEVPESEYVTPMPSLNEEDPFIKEKYFYDIPDGEPVSSSVILNRIANSTHPLNKVAKHLLPYIPKLNDASIYLVDEGDFAGQYTSGINRIDINKNARFRGKGVEATIIHEVMHALTTGELRSNSSSVQKLEEIYNYLKPMFPKYNEETREGTYALSNLDEFTVALFSDSAFIKELIKIPAIDESKNSILQEIFDYILSLFNISEENSIYRQAFNVTSNILDDAVAYSEFRKQQYEYQYAFSPQANSNFAAQLRQWNENKGKYFTNNEQQANDTYQRLKSFYTNAVVYKPKKIRDNLWIVSVKKPVDIVVEEDIKKVINEGYNKDYIPRITKVGENQWMTPEGDIISDADAEFWKDPQAPENLPKFKPTPINALNSLEIEQFKSALETSLQVGGTVNFNYWSESTSEQISEKSIEVLSIDDTTFTGRYPDGTERVFRFKNVISKAVPGKYEVHEQEYFKNNLQVGKTVSFNSNGLSYSGTIAEIGDEDFTIATEGGEVYTIKYASLDKENHQRNILERASEMKVLLEDLIDRFSKNAKSKFQVERIALLQQSLYYLDNYKDLGDLVKFMKLIQSSIFKSRALMEELANPKDLPESEGDKIAEINRRLSMLSFLKDYIDSMRAFDRISFAIAESNSSEQLKNVSAQLTAEIQYASQKYIQVAIPNLADWLWMCFPKKLNSQLLLVGEKEMTKEDLIKELTQPSKDLDFLNAYGVPIANANDLITGLFSKAIKKVLQYAREAHIKMEKNLLPFFKKVQDTGADMKEVYKKFYTIKQMETEDEVEVDGKLTLQKVTKNVRVIIEKYDLQSYYDTVKGYTSQIRALNEKISLTETTNERKALIAQKNKISKELEAYQKVTAINYSATQMNEMMQKLENSNVDKYLENRNKFYRVGEERPDSLKVVTETGETVFYNYNGFFWKPNKEAVNPETGKKVFLTPEYENLMKESEDTINLYNEIKRIYDEKNNLLPEHMRLNGVLPAMYEKGALRDIGKSIKNIGKYNDSQELRQKNKKVTTKLDGEPYQSVPVGYTRILDVTESSDNILEAFILWANDAQMYKAKNDVLGSVDTIVNVLENSKPLEEGQDYKSRINRRVEVLKKYTNQVLYGETRASDKWWDRVFDFMGKFTALTRMFIKPSSALNNLIIGNYALLSEAIGGRNFTTKELWKAHRKYVDLVATNKTKLNNMLITLDAIQGRFKDEIGADFQTFQDTFGFNTAFVLNNTAEHQIQSVSMLALLEKWGVEIPEDGIFEVDKLPENFLGTLHELNKANNGVYSESDRLYYQDESLFRLFLQFRKYIIPMFRTKYSGMTQKGSNKYRIDLESGTVELGYYRAFGEFVWNNVIKIKNLPNLITNYHELNEVEKEGVWRGLVDATAFATISLLLYSLAGGGDDEEWDDDEHGTFENFIHWESIYQMGRLRGDIGTTVPGFGFNDQSRLVNQPFAAIQPVTQLAKIVGMVFDFEEDDEGNISIWKQYERDYGRFEKGDLKILQPISKLLPYDNPYEDLFPHVQYNDFKSASR